MVWHTNVSVRWTVSTGRLKIEYIASIKIVITSIWNETLVQRITIKINVIIMIKRTYFDCVHKVAVFLGGLNVGKHISRSLIHLACFHAPNSIHHFLAVPL